MKDEKKFSFERVIKGKGILLGLIIFFLAVGIGSFAIYKSTISDLTKSGVLVSSDSSSQVNNEASNIPKETTKVSDEDVAVSTDDSIDTNTQPLVMPLEGEIINAYSNGELVKSETLGYFLTHDGVDIKGKLKAPVVSMTNGTVTEVLEDPLFGIEVIIDHGNGVVAHYYNLDKDVKVKVNDTVNSGETIGSVGKTADIESKLEPHLHFGIKQNGKWVDPINFIDPNKSGK